MMRLTGSKGALCALLALFGAAAGCNDAPPISRAEALVSGNADLAERLRPLASAWEPDGDRLVSPGWRSGRMGLEFEIGARLPDRADGVLEVGVGRSERHTLRLYPDGARPVSATLDAGRAIYRGAYAATDALYVTTPERVEVFYLLGSPAAPTEFRWRVTLPEELPGTKWETSGALVFADRAGTGRLRVPRPFALDARGTRRDGELTFADGVLTVRLDANGLAYPILLDPAIETVTWEQVCTSPPCSSTVPTTRYHHAMTFDTARNVVVLQGGWNGTTYRNDTWTWNGTAWTQKCTACGPSNRRWHSMTFDSTRNVAITYGGCSQSDCTHNSDVATDTWEWNGASWSRTLTSAGMGKRYGYGLAYDSVRNRTVINGGMDDASSYYRDTYEYNGTTWTQTDTGYTAPFRYEHAVAYDPNRQRVVHLGGWDVACMGDTWEYDGSTWAAQPWGTSSRCQHGMAYDTARQKMIMFGGEWPGYAPPYLGDTWERAGVTGVVWGQVTPIAATPSARLGTPIVFDRSRGRAVIFGGYNGAALADTWEYHARGGPCTLNTQCDTGHCLNGVCCETAACGTCQDCNLVNPGTCTAISGTPITGTPDPDSCTGANACDPAGACKLVNGQVCTVGTGCVSTFCKTGTDAPHTFCCDAACAGGCNECQSTPGTCKLVAKGQDVLGGCGNYWCDGASPTCPTACAVDGDCKAGTICDGNVCRAAQPLGSACLTDRVCATNHCSDGVCCDLACSGPCDSCVLTGLVGHCNPVVAGQDGTPSCGGYFCQGSAAPGYPACPANCTDDTKCQAGYYCAATGGGTCQPRKAAGTCSSWDCYPPGPSTVCRECTSGNCIDGFCCNTTCGGSCDACNLSGHEGTCTLVSAGGAGSPSCGAYVCTGASAACPSTCASDAGCASGFYCAGTTCTPRKALGQPCTAANQCSSSICSPEGVCCDQACAATCQSCNQAGRQGLCSLLPPGDAGRSPGCGAYVCSGLVATCPGSCTTDAACATGYYCNGSTCVAKLAQGAACTAANQCATGYCSDGRCCNSLCSGGCDVCAFSLGASANGTCTILGAGNPGQNPSCSPRVCNGTSANCPGNCAADSGCASGYYCDQSGQCLTKLPNGSVCTRDAQCTLGHCVDSYCCDTACAGACDTCGAPTHEGTCTFMGSGAAGSPSCGAYVCSGSSASCPISCTASTQCSPGNFCTGGACVSQKPLGAQCGLGSDCKSGLCVDGVCCDSPCSQACDVCNSVASPGVCVPATTGFAGNPSCSPYVCNGTAITCPSWCTTDTDCATGRHCIYGACLGLQPLGASCGSSASCASGNCYDGVCCDMQCDSACMICNKAGSVGACSPAPTGSDPRFMCPGAGACKASCGAGGLCAYPDTTTPCGDPATCTSSTTLHRAWVCDGHGTCTDPGSVECAPYLCATPSCPTSCASDTACTPEAFCDNGSCGARRLPGAACTRSAECDSGHCVDGICCLGTCDGPCQRCDEPAVAGAPLDGICRSPVGADPDGDCGGEGLCTGSCDAEGACAWPGPDTLCDTCKACDRAGGCSQFPPGHDDPACMTVACAALSTECRTYQDLDADRCVAVGLCARPNDPETCTAFADADDGTPCNTGVCFAGACVPELPDGAVPGGDGGTTPETPKSDCGCRSAASADGASAAALALLGLFGLLGRRRRR
jgi:MYXO-CTERM domain-containing protein